MGGGEFLSSLFDFFTDGSCDRHIMTSIAAYFNLTWAIWLRYCLNGKQDDVELAWPSIFTSVPVVVRKGGKEVPKRD
jgi:hypothetical protein